MRAKKRRPFACLGHGLRGGRWPGPRVERDGVKCYRGRALVDSQTRKARAIVGLEVRDPRLPRGRFVYLGYASSGELVRRGFFCERIFACQPDEERI